MVKIGKEKGKRASSYNVEEMNEYCHQQCIYGK